jgi:type III secretion protein Q
VLGLRCGGQMVALQVPDAVLDAVLAGLDPAAAGARGAAGLLLLEAALEPALATAERVLDALAIEDFLAPDPAPPWNLGLAFSLPGGSVAPGRAAIPPALHTRLMALWDGRAPIATPRAGLVVPVAVRVATTEITARDLRSLMPGDALVPDSTRLPHLVAVAAEYQAWLLVPGKGGAAATGARARAAALGLQEWTMEQAALPADAAGIDDIPIRVAFELGRVEMTVGELAGVGPGHVIPLAADPLRGPVDVMANGRRIGRGEIIEVNGVLAIRILSLSA